jgi:hypothetical protein
MWHDIQVLRLEMEKRLLSSFQRLPPLKSSFCGLECATKEDLEINFEDYLNGTHQPKRTRVSDTLMSKVNP